MVRKGCGLFRIESFDVGEVPGGYLLEVDFLVEGIPVRLGGCHLENAPSESADRAFS